MRKTRLPFPLYPEVIVLLLLALAQTLYLGNSARADEDELELVQSVSVPDVRGICCLAISNDGKFAYSAAARAGALVVFKRNADSGELTIADSLKAPVVNGPQRVRISADDKYLVLADSRANAATIFARDPASGALTKVTEATGDLESITDAHLSPDNHFLYAATPVDLKVYRFAEGKLDFVQKADAEGGLKGLRPFTFSPDGRWLYAAAEISGSLTVFRRDEAGGKLEVTQSLNNESDGISTLAGAYRVDASLDGKHVYVSSGRYRGDKAITVFAMQPDGQLKWVQHLVNETGDFTEFEGGNEIRVSPNGKLVYAVASESDRLFRFSRDPESGKIAFITSQQAGVFIPIGAAGVCFSPDGRFVYVSDQSENAIEVYKVR